MGEKVEIPAEQFWAKSRKSKVHSGNCPVIGRNLDMCEGRGGREVSFPESFQILKLIAFYPVEPLGPEQNRPVGHPRQARESTDRQQMEWRVGAKR